MSHTADSTPAPEREPSVNRPHTPPFSEGLLRPDPRLKTAKSLGALGWVGLALAGAAIVGVISGTKSPAPLWVWLLVTVPFLVFAAVGVALAGRFVRNHGFAERDEDFIVARGALFRSVVSVPYGRIQYCTVEQGPVLSRFGLASVTLHTAASDGEAKVEGLPLDEAEALKERLVALGSSRLAGL
ncbi:PH domain-containing protein [Falsarthrobacter nasiphocae]|uniref:Membrane protein YdbS with pleckstrin-like domain n=1 Tax=Falsarthrobacter nasiphocae TaxID=189863 RepID=A0AAE4C6B5_9MICC|nr:PH domain-containing protein [Falsarthrobacter nasiphocae]MDR6891982.1 membrane protein YdbS with pleckstrin-like domain [Falsarthrobacter nasiphocae]